MATNNTRLTATSVYASPYAERIAKVLNQSENYGSYKSAYAGRIKNLANRAANYGPYQSQYADRIAGLVDQAETRDPYQSQYADEIADLTQGLRDSRFEYDAASDPQYAALRKQYLREADRTMSDVLAKTSAATGGRASSYAVNAASQAANYYKSQLADRQIDLFNSAYSRYLQEYQQRANLLTQLQGQDETEYNRWQNDYTRLLQNINLLQTQDATAYQRYGDDYSRLLQNLGVLQGQDETEYNRWQNGYTQLLQNLNALQGQDSAEYTRWNNSQQTQISATDKAYSNLVTAIATTGYSPSAAELLAAGMSQSEAKAWRSYYNQQQALAASGGSSGGGGGSYRSRSSSGSGGESVTVPVVSGSTVSGSPYGKLDGLTAQDAINEKLAVKALTKSSSGTSSNTSSINKLHQQSGSGGTTKKTTSSSAKTAAKSSAKKTTTTKKTSGANKAVTK